LACCVMLQANHVQGILHLSSREEP
jgi:hypothetical protein